jgi:RHS repeat-associated protein
MSASTGFVTTVAGNGVVGFSGDGSAATAAEIQPSYSGIAVDSSGNIYIADWGNERIREVSASTGIITTVAGNGTAGYSGDGGLATSAELHWPEAVAVDSAGDIYITDAFNHVVREVNHSTGDISTVVGNGTSGSSGDGGLATSAELNEPWGIALDSSGNLYVGDYQNHTVREVNHSTGDIATVAGTGTAGYSGDGGPATLAKLSHPTDITADSSGNLYIDDSGNSAVREVNAATGAIVSLATGLSGPEGVAVDASGNAYVAVAGQYKIDEISAAPIPISFSPATLSFAETKVDATSSGLSVTVKNTGLSTLSIASDALSGADASDFSITADSCSGAALASNATCSVAVEFIPRVMGPLSADLTFSDGISSGLHSVYLAGEGGGYVSTIAGTGTAGYSGDGGPALSANIGTSVNSVSGIALDSSGNVYIDAGTRIREVNAATGIVTTVAGNGTAGYSGDGGLATSAEIRPNQSGIAVDSSGNLFIADFFNQRIREVSASTGIITTVAGNGTAGYSGDGGLATSAELHWPQGVALDSAGDIYITDEFNHVVREVNHSTGDISTVAGNGTSGSSGDGGLATSAELNEPWGIALDSSGNIYVGDYVNATVREINHSTGDISKVAGVGYSNSVGDGGPATLAYLYDPTQIAVDSSGNLYIADTSHSDIREVNAGTGIIESLDSGTGYIDPEGLTVDPSDNVYVADNGHYKIDEISGLGAVPNGGLIGGSGSSSSSGPGLTSAQRFGGGGGIAPGTCSCNTGDPIDTASGDFHQTVTDTSLPTYGPPLAFSRTYDAFLAQEQVAASSPGPLGYGWTDTYATSLALNADYNTAVSGDVTLNQANGAQALFVPPVSGSCQTPYVGPGTSGTYCTLPRVLGSLTYNSGSSTYTLIEHPTATYTFNSSGKLVSIADPDGASESLTYNSPSPGSGNCPSGAGSCETVTSASGRTLTLGWSGPGDTGTITSVTDPLGRQTSYAYTSSNLTSVTDPLSNVTSYTYDSSNANAALKHDLLTITKPNGQSGGPDAGDALTNTYNSSGQVTSQSDPMGRVTSFSYTGINAANLTGVVVVTDPDANETAYTFNDGTLVEKVAGYGSASPSSTTYVVDASTLLDDSITDANNNTTTSTYNSNGDLLTKTNPLGKTWTYSYNSFDEQTCATEPLSANPCSALSPPSAITAGTSTITPPSSAAPKYATYAEYDTAANKIYQTTGDYAPGSGSASQSRTSYQLYNGQSVTLGGTNDSCSNTAPSTELPCATIDPNAVVTQLGYNSAGNLTSKATPDGNSGGELATTTYGYDTDGEQTSKVAPDGNLSGANAANFTTSTAFNADGEVTSATIGGASGHSVVPRMTSNTYDANGNLTASAHITSPDLIGTTSGSNASSSLALGLPQGTLPGDEVVLSTTTSPASGSETATTPSGYTLLDSQNTGQTTTYVYAHTVGSGDTGVTLAYSTSDAKVAVLAVYRGLNAASPVDVYDDATTSSGTSVAASALTTTNPGDKLVLVGGAGQQGSSATWSAPGSMTSEVQAQLSGNSSILADGSGPASAGSSGGKTATTSASGQLVAVFLALAPGAITTTTSYDADDEATLVVDPDGNTTLTCYDGDANAAEVVPPVGVAANTLTAASCPTSYPSGYGDRLATDATTTSYNALGLKVTITTPAPPGLSGYETTTYAYDPAGRVISVTAPPTSTTGGAPNEVTTHSYDAAGELLTTTTGSGTGAASTTSYCYDPDGNKTASVAPDGNTSSVASCSSSSPYGTSSAYQTANSYDSLGELVTKTAPSTTWASSGQVTTNTYDPAGNLLTSEDPNGVTATDAYTPLDQVASVSYSGSAAHSVAYTYDANGNRTAMTDASGTSSYTYNPFDEMTADDNGAGLTTSYTHDALGNTIGVTYPLGAGATWASTDTVAYAYDAASRLTSATDFNGNTTVIANTADGLPSSVGLGASGDVVSSTYAPTDSPSAINLTQGATTLLGFSYANVPSGAIASETDTPSSSLSPADYTYDAQSRVTQMTPGSTSALNYGYDASGNLTTLPTGGSGTYDHASELTSSVQSGTTTSYTFNADGERTQASVGGSTTVSAAYNGAEELTSYSNAAANTSSATYDGDGLRTSATTTPAGGGATTENFAWNETTSVPNLLMDSTNAYIYGPSGTPVEQVNLSSGTPNYLVADALGSVRGIVSASGSLTASISYDASGNPETTGGLTTYTPFGFAGGYTDPTGLIYLIHRYYDPSTGQFLSVDPMVDQTGQPYAYAGDDPVNGVDPLGLFGCPSWVVVGCGEANTLVSGTAAVTSCIASGSCNTPEGLANIVASFGNSAVNSADRAICSDPQGVCPTWSISTPYPCSAYGSSQLGEVLLFASALLIPGGDEADVAANSARAASAAAEAESQIPESAQAVLDYAEAHNGLAPPGYMGGDTFYNNEGLLPAFDLGGNPISYREYDVSPYQKGVNRGGERIVVGSNGSAYYTDDHYTTFIPFG